MPQIFDPLIIFIASNAIFLAIGAVFSTISNEIFTLEKEGDNFTPKYASANAHLLRRNITKYISGSFLIYLTHFIFIVLFLILKYLFFKVIKSEIIYFFELSLIFLYVINLSWLVSRVILLFKTYFEIRNEHFFLQTKPIELDDDDL